MREFDSHRSYTVNYSQGSGYLNVDFKITHDREYDFQAELILRTTTTGNVEEIGITNYQFEVNVDEEFRLTRQESYVNPLISHRETFLIAGIYRDSLTICEGDVDVQFNVNEVVQNETINFEIAIRMPIDPALRFFEHDVLGVWIEVILFIVLGVLIISISKVIKKVRYEVVYPEKEKKRDNEFWNFIEKKAEKQKQE